MRKQQEDTRAKRFLNEKDLNNNNLALEMRRRDNARDKNKRYIRKHKKRRIQDAS